MLPKPSTSSSAIKSLTQTLVRAHTRTHTHTDVWKQGAHTAQSLWMGETCACVRTHRFFLSKTHLAHYDRVISNEVFITESQVFNMSHISACACQEAPPFKAALSQVEQEERETENEKEQSEKERQGSTLLVLYIDLPTLYILIYTMWAIWDENPNSSVLFQGVC